MGLVKSLMEIYTGMRKPKAPELVKQYFHIWYLYITHAHGNMYRETILEVNMDYMQFKVITLG